MESSIGVSLADTDFFFLAALFVELDGFWDRKLKGYGLKTYARLSGLPVLASVRSDERFKTQLHCFCWSTELSQNREG